MCVYIYIACVYFYISRVVLPMFPQRCLRCPLFLEPLRPHAAGLRFFGGVSAVKKGGFDHETWGKHGDHGENMGLYGIIWHYTGLYAIIWDYMGLYGIIWNFNGISKETMWKTWGVPQNGLIHHEI